MSGDQVTLRGEHTQLTSDLRSIVDDLEGQDRRIINALTKLAGSNASVSPDTLKAMVNSLMQPAIDQRQELRDHLTKHIGTYQETVPQKERPDGLLKINKAKEQAIAQSLQSMDSLLAKVNSLETIVERLKDHQEATVTTLVESMAGKIEGHQSSIAAAVAASIDKKLAGIQRSIVTIVNESIDKKLAAIQTSIAAAVDTSLEQKLEAHQQSILAALDAGNDKQLGRAMSDAGSVEMPVVGFGVPSGVSRGEKHSRPTTTETELAERPALKKAFTDRFPRYVSSASSSSEPSSSERDADHAQDDNVDEEGFRKVISKHRRKHRRKQNQSKTARTKIQRRSHGTDQRGQQSTLTPPTTGNLSARGFSDPTPPPPTRPHAPTRYERRLAKGGGFGQNDENSKATYRAVLDAALAACQFDSWGDRQFEAEQMLEVLLARALTLKRFKPAAFDGEKGVAHQLNEWADKNACLFSTLDNHKARHDDKYSRACAGCRKQSANDLTGQFNYADMCCRLRRGDAPRTWKISPYNK